MRERHFQKFVFFIFTFFPTLLFSQKSQVYESDFVLNNGHEGKAKFEYKIYNGDTILNGQFDFHSTVKDEDVENKVYNKLYKGVFNEGKKNGDWKFSYKTLSKKSESLSVDGYSIVNNVDGEEYYINAYFENGAANGKWQAAQVLIKDSKVSDTLFLAQSNFKNNMGNGTLKSMSEKIKLQGDFSKEGVLDKQWIFIHGDKNNIIEIRDFNNGILLNHSFIIGKDTLKVNNIGLDTSVDEENEEWEDVEVGKKYFDIIYFTNFGLINNKSNVLDTDSTIKLVENSNNFLQTTLLSFTKHNGEDVWGQMDGVDLKVNAKFKVRKYPFDKKEKINIEKFNQLYYKNKKIIEEYLSDSQVNLERYSNKEMSVYFELMSVYDSKLEKLSKIAELLKSPALEYINRGDIFKVLCPNINYPEKIIYSIRSQESDTSHTFPVDIDKDSCNVEVLHEQMKAMSKDIEEINKKARKIVERYKKQDALKGKENQLTQKKDSIILLFEEGKEEDYNKYHKDFSEKIIQLTRDNFKTYASSGIETKIDLIDDKLSCFDSIISFYGFLVEMEKKIQNIDETYIRTIWNPYTFTDMDERVKERLYKAYENILLPFIISDMKDNITCENFNLKKENFNKVHKYMAVNREKDTSEVEKSLRRVTKVGDVIEILKLDLN